MGVSTSHASMIGLILKTHTRSVTPQYHVIHDDWFATMPNAEGGGAVTETEQDALESRKLIKARTEHYIEEKFDENGDPLPVPELHDEWLTEAKKAARQQRDVGRLRASYHTSVSDNSFVYSHYSANYECYCVASKFRSRFILVLNHVVLSCCCFHSL